MEQITTVVIGYMGVSRTDGLQVLKLQRAAPLGVGIPATQLYEDYVSGTRDNRTGLEACLEAQPKAGTLVNLINLIHDLPGRGVAMKNIVGHDANLDTTTANGRFVFGIFAALAAFLRELIFERNCAGLASARYRGCHGGRLFTMISSKLRLAQATMGQMDTKVGIVCREFTVTRRTLYRRVDLGGALRPYEEKLLGPAARRQSSNARSDPMSS
jgi:DNA invertase Pin-like site-specific DNA recombinase